MRDRLVTTLVPLLAEPSAPEFNVFQVLHHGTHEKQISNLFAWLLDPDGTHQLGETFQRIFIDQATRSRPGTPVIDSGPYSVRQEVNTSPPDEAPDIADLVLESEESVMVVENYHVSDGHGHNYHRYRGYGAHRHLADDLGGDAPSQGCCPRPHREYRVCGRPAPRR